MHALGPLILIGLIAFAFGERTARIVTAIALLAALAFFGYIMFRIMAGTI